MQILCWNHLFAGPVVCGPPVAWQPHSRDHNQENSSPDECVNEREKGQGRVPLLCFVFPILCKNPTRDLLTLGPQWWRFWTRSQKQTETGWEHRRFHENEASRHVLSPPKIHSYCFLLFGTFGVTWWNMLGYSKAREECSGSLSPPDFKASPV